MIPLIDRGSGTAPVRDNAYSTTVTKKRFGQILHLAMITSEYVKLAAEHTADNEWDVSSYR